MGDQGKKQQKDKKKTAKTAVQLRGGDEVMFGGSKRKYIVVMRGGVTG